MAFESLSEFFAMGNHGLFVWLAYGVSLVCIGYLLVAPVLKHRKLLRTIKQRAAINAGAVDIATGERS